MGLLTLAIAEPQQQHCTFGSPPLSLNAYLVHNELCPEPIFQALHCSVHSVDHVLHNQHLPYIIIRIKSKEVLLLLVGFETHDLKEVRTIVPSSNLHLNIYNNGTL